ncbi:MULTISPECIES: IclR family transcriptional regulator [unclassified Streptomyces]|uniref:IclR family transcriptional regulator n=1 Tax=unclassified Streptomyces TaxID=2593676 RepID=UPI0022548B31|nr:MULTISPECIES: IclR family transcriptional regulator [unclassified Streptomyces]MCX4989513.1 IclR family transcriptional regulator [Streptomyces sp. NBC_00568]MCX5005247.1 IclR family transcriptional regulator [Streptomyces sp. NBC_00638]
MVQAVQRAVQILRELASTGPRLGVTELADRLGVAKPTVHALLRTLEAEGLVAQDRHSSKYQLGPNLVQLGNAYLDTQELRTRSLTWADQLANRTNEAVWVAVLTGDHVLVVHHAFRPEGAVQILEVGASIPWSTCALGKAIVAFVPADERERLLAGEPAVLTGASITDPEELAGHLKEVLRTGYAIEDQESAIGDAGIASPVFDRSGEVVGALGVVGPVERLLAESARQELAVAVRETARNLSRDLGAPRSASARTTMT